MRKKKPVQRSIERRINYSICLIEDLSGGQRLRESGKSIHNVIRETFENTQLASQSPATASLRSRVLFLPIETLFLTTKKTLFKASVLLLGALAFHIPVPAQGAPDITPSLKKMLGTLPIAGIKDELQNRVGALQKTSCGGNLTGCYATRSRPHFDDGLRPRHRQDAAQSATFSSTGVR